MVNTKFVVRYRIPGRAGDFQATVNAPDADAAKHIGQSSFGNVIGVYRDWSASDHPSSDEGRDRGILHEVGRDIAREQLGVLGASLSDEVITVMIFLVLALPVIGLWLGVPVYEASLLAPKFNFPPATLCVGVGVFAFVIGWIILYFCPIILMRVVGFATYAGWLVSYLTAWSYNSDILRQKCFQIIVSNTDATNLQKLGLLIAGVVGGSIMANLTKLVQGK